MSDGSEPPPRQPKDIQGLLRLCMATAPQEPPQTSTRLQPMDTERSQWLSSALHSMTTNVIQEMIKALEVLKNGLNERTEDGMVSNETVEQMVAAIESLIDETGNLDNAIDYYKIGGFDVFRPLLGLKSDVIKAKTCELLAEVVQNEIHCQSYAMDSHLLEELVSLLDKEVNESLRIKSLYAISCLIRDNDSAEEVFVHKLNGLSLLLRAMDSTNPLSKDNKLRIKASFLMRSLCQKTSVCDSLYDLGALDQLVGALQGEHDSTHEHLLAALYELVSVHQTSSDDCRRREWGLKKFLKQRIDDLNGSEEFAEELDYCKRLLALLFVDHQLPDSER